MLISKQDNLSEYHYIIIIHNLLQIINENIIDAEYDTI